MTRRLLFTENFALLDLLKVLGGTADTQKKKDESEKREVHPAADKPRQDKSDHFENAYNPMASVIERHESAVNRLRRTK